MSFRPSCQITPDCPRTVTGLPDPYLVDSTEGEDATNS